MKPSPAFQFYAQDFLVGCADLSAEQTGAYIRMLCYQWVKDGLPNDPEKIASMVGCHGNAMALPMHKFGICEDGLLRNKRLEDVRKEQSEYRRKQSENANARWSNQKEECHRIATALPLDMPNACSSSSSSSSNKEYTDDFLKAWFCYPNKVGKADAFKSWKKLKPVLELQETILKAMEVQKKWPSWIQDGGKYIPHFSTWMNGRKWEDEGLVNSLKQRPQIY